MPRRRKRIKDRNNQENNYLRVNFTAQQPMPADQGERSGIELPGYRVWDYPILEQGKVRFGVISLP
jgi:hypothetical protein